MLDIHGITLYGKDMVDWVFSVWQFPYFRWHIFFTCIPTIIIWSVWGNYLLSYKKTLLYATIVAVIYGIPADILASPGLHLWVFVRHAHFGPQLLGLPLGEYVFILLTPQLIVSLLLVVRGKLYGKI